MAAAATARKLIVEVVEARNLVPKDGSGTSSPYARADFDGQRRKTRTVARDLNPAWKFDFPPAGVDAVEGEPLEVAVLHDLRVGPTSRSNFLGRVRLDARQFVRGGEEALIYFPLKKEKGFLNSFNWVRGDIGLKVYYVDVPLAPPEPEPPAAGNDGGAAATASTDEPPKADEPMDAAAPAPQPEAAATTEKPPEVDPAPATPAPPEDAPVMTAEAVAASEEKASLP